MIWIIMIVTGLLNFAMRISMFSGLFQGTVAPSLRSVLRFVPIAVLSAVIAAAVFIDPASGAVSVHFSKVLAATLAAIVAWITQSVLATIAVGLSTIWIMGALI
jgi:branched-subunit amino acid transport protein